MKKRNIFYMLLTGISTVVFLNYNQINNATSNSKYLVKNKAMNPNKLTHKKSLKELPPKERDYNISTEDFIKARKQARAMKAHLQSKNMIGKSKYSSKIKTETLYSLPPRTTTPHWQMRGPYTYGRVTAIVADPENPDKVYVGTPQGGVWKSTDGGKHYEPIFDNAGALSIGSLALDPHDSDIIYVGTGECDFPSLQVDTLGDGLWKSTDGGHTWEHLGLEDKHRIGSIVINPNNTMEIFATSYRDGAGIFRSRDGGKTWENISEATQGLTNVRSLQMDPEYPRRLYASSWAQGDAAVWKSDDTGDTWVKLTKNLTTKTNEVIFSVAPSSINRLYVAYPIKKDIYTTYYEIYSSNDFGSTWKKKPATIDNFTHKVEAPYSKYCGKLIVSPNDKNTFYILDVDLYKSIDGGEYFDTIDDNHVDHHSLWISPDGDTVYSGNDGGVYLSNNYGDTDTYILQSIPIGQFYAMSIDPINHNRLLGGMQDNGFGYTTDGFDWHNIGGGDGMTVLVDNTDTKYMYGLSQYGNVSFVKKHHILKILKIPSMSWKVPITLDPFDNKVVYYGGTDYIYKTTRTGDELSELTKASLKKFDRIYDIHIPLSAKGKTLYVIDFNGIWVSKDKGITWTSSAFKFNNSLKNITTDPQNDAIAYASCNGYGDNKNTIFRTTDYGQTWTNITSNLPYATSNSVLVDPNSNSTLYVATDFGVFISLNTGKTWEPLGLNLPEIKVNDLKIVKEGTELILYAGTYGRGIYSVHLNSTQRGIHKPSKPSNIEVNNTQETTTTITWKDNSHNEIGFKVYKGTNSIPVATLKSNVTSYTPTGLSQDTNYTYSVKAYNDAGESEATTISFKTLAVKFIKAYLLSPRENSILSSRTMTVEWKRNSANRVDLEVYDITHGKDLFYKTVTGKSKKVPVPINGEKILILLYSYNASNHFKGVKYFYVTAQTKVTKKYITSPTNNNILTSNTMTVHWNKNDASKFFLYVGVQSNAKPLFSGYVTSTSKTVPVPTHGERIHIMLIPCNASGMMDGREDIYVNAKK